MQMPEFHQRVLDVALSLCHTYDLVLAGGYAMRAHGLVDRPSQDVDLATFTATPLEDITARLASAYQAAGFEVETLRGTPLLARLAVTDSVTGQLCAVDLMKKPLQRPAVMMDVGPVASLDDIVGMKVAALHGRSVPRDLIDLHSVGDLYHYIQLERLGALFEDEFRLDTLSFQLNAGLAFNDAAFAEYGIDQVTIRQLRRFVVEWSDDLSMRLAEQAQLSLEP